jgi:hypothetical protein
MMIVYQVLAMCFVRKALDWVFTRHELKWLDDIMPESHKREKEEKKKKLEQELKVYYHSNSIYILPFGMLVISF